MSKLTEVSKLDGSKQNYIIDKIEYSVFHAGATTQIAKKVAQKTNDLLEKINEEITTKLIRQKVEEQLATIDEKIYKYYKMYRKEQQENMQLAFDLGAAIGKLVSADKAVVNENANKDFNVFNAKRDLTAGAVAKTEGLKMLPPAVAQAHVSGKIHFHDLDYHPYMPMTNCSIVDFPSMLKNGYTMGNATVESPKSIETATAQIAQIILNVASSQYGGITVNRIDEFLIPYAEKTWKKQVKICANLLGLNVAETEVITQSLNNEGQNCVPEHLQRPRRIAMEQTSKLIYDAMQSLEFSLNSTYVGNGQTPFVTVNFGLATHWLGREIQKSILKVRLAGLGKGKKTAVFPKLVFTLRQGVNLRKADPNYDIKQLALQCCAKRIYPDVLSYDKIVELTGSFKAPMGCRSFLPAYTDPETGQEYSQGRMNLGVVTLNLPRIALESAGDKNRFWQILDQRMELVRQALDYRIRRCEEATVENAPILYKNGGFGKRLKSGDKVSQLFKNGRATVSVGYIGLYEVGAVFYGAEWEKNSQAVDFVLSVLKFMDKTASEWTREQGYKYSIYSTPSESLTDRFCKLDTERFGLVQDITSKEYYTNSFHLDVRKKWDPFSKIDFEKQFAPYTTGGFIHYVEAVIGVNISALETLWDYAYERVGYFGVNTPIDKCFVCGYNGDFEATSDGFKCPDCGNADPDSTDVVKRLCGYLGNPVIRPMIHGRHVEISSRSKHE